MIHVIVAMYYLVSLDHIKIEDDQDGKSVILICKKNHKQYRLGLSTNTLFRMAKAFNWVETIEQESTGMTMQRCVKL